MSEPAGSGQAPVAGHLAGRLTNLGFIAGFWLPLAVCTWLALTPSPPDSVFRVSDVVLHAAAFSYLTFTLGLAFPRLRWPVLAGVMLGYGLLIEVVQGLGAARTAELKDLLVDAAGIAAGLTLLAALGEWSRRTVRALLAVAVR